MLAGNVKTLLASLNSDERRQAMAFLITLGDDRQAHRARMAAKIDDKDPSHWATIEDLNKRLGLEGTAEVKGYRLLIDFEVLDFLASKPRSLQTKLRNCFLTIWNDPIGLTDFEDIDETGRPLNIHICHDFAVEY